jgi:hypothetical protein
MADPQTDPVATLLRAAPTSDAVRASAWDAYEQAGNEDDLAERIKALPLPTHIKAQLWDLKHAASKPPDFQSENATDDEGHSLVSDALGVAKDVVGGVRAGLANTVFGGGDLIRRGLGMERIVDQPDVKALMTPPDSMAGKIGYHGEQIGEFFAPTGMVGKAGKIAEVAKSGLLTLAQTGGDVKDAGVSAGLAAAVPMAGAAITKGRQALSGALESSAQRTIAQALGATKEWAKAEAAKLAPQILERGVGGSRKAMLDTAKATAKRVGGELEHAYQAAAAAGETVSGDVIRGNLQLAADALKVKLPNGTLAMVPGTERVIDRLQRLDEFVGSLGSDIPVDTAAKLKRTWDHIVSKAGLYGPKATATATDTADSWAYREAAGAFRTLLNTNPTIEALNKEVAFWTGLKRVLAETAKRTQAQRGGLTDAVRGAAGAAAGASAGGPVGAFAGGMATQQLSALLNSAAWKTKVAGPLKQALAEALAAGSGGRVANVTSRIVASLPAQLRPSFAQ